MLVFPFVAGRRSSRSSVHPISSRNYRLDVSLPAPPSVFFRIVSPVSSNRLRPLSGASNGLRYPYSVHHVGKKADSCRCPAVRRVDIGRPFPSATRCILVENPPRPYSRAGLTLSSSWLARSPSYHHSVLQLPSGSPGLSCCPHPTAPSRFDPLRRALPEAHGRQTATSRLRPTGENGRKRSSKSRAAQEGLARELLSGAPKRCHLQPSSGPRRAGLFRRLQEEHPQCARIARRSVRSGGVRP